MADLAAENTASEGLPDCPFCGGELSAVVLAADVGGGPGVSCGGCGAYTSRLPWHEPWLHEGRVSGGRDDCTRWAGAPVTSLFSRLQKLNKEATPGPWFLVVNDLIGGKSVSTVDAPMSQIEPRKSLVPADMLNSDVEGELIVECRNSLPAVLNLIEAVKESRWWATEWASTGSPYAREQMAAANVRVDEALAVFVSGQEEAP